MTLILTNIQIYKSKGARNYQTYVYKRFLVFQFISGSHHDFGSVIFSDIISAICVYSNNVSRVWKWAFSCI